MGNIATPNIIKASDIMDLTNNSITTGNIYASGTSATIGTSNNPFNSVYANTYYGTKFTSTYLGGFTPTTAGKLHTLNSGDMSLFPFISIQVNGWGAMPIFLPWSVISEKNNIGACMYMYGQSNGCLCFYAPTGYEIYCSDSLTSGLGYVKIFGYK